MQQYNPNNFPSMFKEVSTMNLAFGNTFGNNTTARIQKQCANIPDEFKELQAAIAAKDFTEVRDAMCDILVFSLGAFHLMGRDFDELYGHNDVPLIEFKGGWTLFEKLEAHAQSFDELMSNLYLSLTPDGGPRQAEEDLYALITWAMQIADITGYPALADMHAVYVSNMSKFCANDEELDATVDKYRALKVALYAEGEYPTMCVKSSEDQKDINGDNYPKGKFLKGVKYQPPVFA